MTSTTDPAVAIRTTSDGAGPPEGIATGMGPSPELALSALQRAAQAAAREAVASAEGQASQGFAGRIILGMPHALRKWQFEVVDVRLVPTAMEGGESGWLAYGTLTGRAVQQDPRSTIPVPTYPPKPPKGDR